MTRGIEPNPRKNMLKAGPYSFMNFMPEQLIYDQEEGRLIRFRAMFEMPNWDGVEKEETTYTVTGSTERLDQLAEKFWGIDRVELYWVIAARNKLDLPSAQLYEGRKLKIPSKNWIDTRFLTQSEKYFER